MRMSWVDAELWQTHAFPGEKRALLFFGANSVCLVPSFAYLFALHELPTHTLNRHTIICQEESVLDIWSATVKIHSPRATFSLLCALRLKHIIWTL
jgi:hypothetical protein